MRTILLLAVFWLASGLLSAAESARITLERTETNLLVRALASDGKTWTTLVNYVAENGERPYMHPVFDARGKVVLTQDRPDDHPWQHGIFTGFHRVNGFNYWKEDEGRQRLLRVEEIKGELDKVSWKSVIELVSPSGEIVLEESNTITVHAPRSEKQYWIDFRLVLRAKERPVQFGNFFVGGLSVRMPWDKANPRQAHLNSEGLRGRAGEQQRAAWCTVERPFGEEVFGFAIFDDSRNPNHPPVWRVDEQGLINPNVSGVGDWTLAEGESRQFDYRIVVYRGSENFR
jgi:hypothetical protein